MKTSRYILDTARDYAIYVCDQRALPRVTDGLKSSQRKAIWVARKHKGKIKTISLAGEMISSGLYVHGDSSASQVISLMAAKYCNNICWFDGYGAFGTIVDPKSFGAPRYTYVKLSDAAKRLLLIDEDIIPLQENYDGSTYEPETFLPLIPTVLLNGISGIAIGWATEILPHSSIDIIDATIRILKGEEIGNLLPKYENYDVNIIQKRNLEYEICGKIEKAGKTRLKIISIPPEMSLEHVKNHLVNLMEKDIIKNFEDLSTDRIEIEISCSREIADKPADELIELFKLKTIKHERIVVIDFDGKTIKQYDSHDALIRRFVEWRKRYIKKRYEKRIETIQKEMRRIKSFLACYENDFPGKIRRMKAKDIDEVLSKILGSENLEDVSYLKNLPIYKWSKEEYEKSEKTLEALEREMKDCLEILQDSEKIVNIYINELEELKKEFLQNGKGK